MTRELVDQRRTQADAPREVADAVQYGIEILDLAAVEGLVVRLAQRGVAERLHGALQQQVEMHVAVLDELVAHHRRHLPTAALPREEVVVDGHPHADIVAMRTGVDEYGVAQQVAVGRIADDAASDAGIEFGGDLVAHLHPGEPRRGVRREFRGVYTPVVEDSVEHRVGITLLVVTAL